MASRARMAMLTSRRSRKRRSKFRRLSPSIWRVRRSSQEFASTLLPSSLISAQATQLCSTQLRARRKLKVGCLSNSLHRWTRCARRDRTCRTTAVIRFTRSGTIRDTGPLVLFFDIQISFARCG
ncbi:hypothetical protein NXC14_PC00687 (plasmid) [Rhizobium sp. NXC14]|nr:hypothetical protein NXC14_PC00687 [Rhizobium sp. NXC14]